MQIIITRILRQNTWKNAQKTPRFLKKKNSPLELENDFIGLKDGELKDWERCNVTKHGCWGECQC